MGLIPDIDTNVLGTAERGIYQKDQFYQIPEEFHVEFDMGTKEIASWVRVNKRIKEKITFEPFNLTSSTYPWKDEFDIIFCRNVLIYFNSSTISHVAKNTYQAASSDSFLFIAHSESLQNVKSQWKYVKPSLYRKCN